MSGVGPHGARLPIVALATAAGGIVVALLASTSNLGALVLAIAIVLLAIAAGVVGLALLAIAELRSVNARLAETRLMLFTLIQDLHFIHRITMSSFPEVLEGVGSGDNDQEGRHGSGEAR